MVRGKRTILNILNENHHQRIKQNCNLDKEGLLYREVSQAITKYFSEEKS